MFYYVNAIIRRGKKEAFWTGEIRESREEQGQQSVEDEFQAGLEDEGYKVYVICTPRAFRTTELVDEWYKAKGESIDRIYGPLNLEIGSTVTKEKMEQIEKRNAAINRWRDTFILRDFNDQDRIPLKPVAERQLPKESYDTNYSPYDRSPWKPDETVEAPTETNGHQPEKKPAPRPVPQSTMSASAAQAMRERITKARAKVKGEEPKPAVVEAEEQEARERAEQVRARMAKAKNKHEPKPEPKAERVRAQVAEKKQEPRAKQVKERVAEMKEEPEEEAPFIQGSLF